MFRQGHYPGTTGVLLVDNLGLPIESSGNFDKTQSGLISSIMKNAAKLEKLLGGMTSEASIQMESNYYNKNQQTDITAKIYFKEENLVVRNKQGMTLALRQKS